MDCVPPPLPHGDSSLTQLPPVRPVALIAHRGYSARAPENTLASLEAAVRAGSDGIEWDMSTAACGTPVLFHDSTLERTTNGHGALTETPWSELRDLDAGGWYDTTFAGEGVPSLQLACEALNTWGYEGRIVAEIKGWTTEGDVDRMVETMMRTGRHGHARYIAIDWAAIDRVARAFPGAPVAFIVERPDRFDDALDRAGSVEGAGLAVDFRILLEDPRRLEAALSRGLAVGVWTVDDPTAAARLHSLGIRDFTTNEVERLRGWADTLADRP